MKKSERIEALADALALANVIIKIQDNQIARLKAERDTSAVMGQRAIEFAGTALPPLNRPGRDTHPVYGPDVVHHDLGGAVTMSHNGHVVVVRHERFTPLGAWYTVTEDEAPIGRVFKTKDPGRERPFMAGGEWHQTLGHAVQRLETIDHGGES